MKSRKSQLFQAVARLSLGSPRNAKAVLVRAEARRVGEDENIPPPELISAVPEEPVGNGRDHERGWLWHGPEVREGISDADELSPVEKEQYNDFVKEGRAAGKNGNAEASLTFYANALAIFTSEKLKSKILHLIVCAPLSSHRSLSSHHSLSCHLLSSHVSSHLSPLLLS
jgi:hypothetical protein